MEAKDGDGAGKGGRCTRYSASFLLWAIAISLTFPAIVWAEEVTLSELERVTIASSVMHQQVLRQKGGMGYPKLQVDAELQMLAAGTARLTTYLSSYGKKTYRSKAIIQDYKLDQPIQVVTLGGGYALMTFQNGTLTILRVYKTGAAKREYVFTKGPSGLTCSVSESYVREVGANAIVLESPFGLGRISIISDKQVSSSCRIKGQ